MVFLNKKIFLLIVIFSFVSMVHHNASAGISASIRCPKKVVSLSLLGGFSMVHGLSTGLGACLRHYRLSKNHNSFWERFPDSEKELQRWLVSMSVLCLGVGTGCGYSLYTLLKSK